MSKISSGVAVAPLAQRMARHVVRSPSTPSRSSLYAEKLARVQGMIAEKPDAERPALEKSLTAIQAQVQHMQPLGLRSGALSEGGVYSEVNIDAS